MADQKILLELQLENGQLKVATRESKQAIEDLGRSVKKSGEDGSTGASKLSQGFFSLKTIALGAVTAVVAGLYKIASSGLSAAASLEKNQIAISSMLGSVGSAKKLLDDLVKFSAKTPLELPGLITTTKQLIAFGIPADQIIQKLTNLGNVAQGNQEIMDRVAYAYGKVAAKGKASMEELNMIIEAGVPILDELSKQYNVTGGELLKMVENGKVGFSAVDKALTSLTTGNGAFSGILEQQASSLSGLFSSFKDNMGLATMEIVSGLVPALKELLKILNESEVIIPTITFLFKTLFSIIGAALSALNKILYTIEDGFRRARNMKNTLELTKQLQDLQAQQKGLNKNTTEYKILQDKILETQYALNKAQGKGAADEIANIRHEIDALKERNKEWDKKRDSIFVSKSTIDGEIAANNKLINEYERRIKKQEEVYSQAEKLANKFEQSQQQKSGFNPKTLLPSDNTTSSESSKTEKPEWMVSEFAQSAEYQYAQSSIGAAGNAISELDSILQQATENELARIENKKQAKLNAIAEEFAAESEAIKASTLDSETKVSKLKALDEKRARDEQVINDKAAKEKRKIEREAAQRNKAIKTIEIIINTASSIMQAFAQLGPIGGGIYSAILAGLGIAQIAIVQQQPLPALATGTVQVPQDMVAQIHRNEMIVPATFAEGVRKGEVGLGNIEDVKKKETYVQNNIYLDGEQILSYIQKATEDGRMFVHSRAVVR